MTGAASQILRTYLLLVLFSTFSTSLIWGINTLFLLDAGLSITQAFVANAFFTVGQVLFEVPTGIVADTFGRRVSFLLGSATLFVSTILYLLLWQISGPMWGWAVVSVLLGLGFTFYSGATEAWLVDGLTASDYEGTLDGAFAKGEVVAGAAMLTGSLAGGAIAQLTHLGIPYLLRALMLAITFLVALFMMREIGFTPRRGVSIQSIPDEMARLFMHSWSFAARNRPVRWLMLAGPFLAGVGYYAFYAMQPYLLELYGSSDSFAIAGLAAAIVAGAQIMGGLAVPWVRQRFGRRTELLLAAATITIVALAVMGLIQNFWVALSSLALWALVDSASYPVRQAFINGLIPSSERATILSSDNLLSSSGGVVQPVLGRVADLGGYAASYIVGAGLACLSLPFIWLARRENAPSDPIDKKK